MGGTGLSLSLKIPERAMQMDLSAFLLVLQVLEEWHCLELVVLMEEHPKAQKGEHLINLVVMAS